MWAPFLRRSPLLAVLVLCVACSDSGGDGDTASSPAGAGASGSGPGAGAGSGSGASGASGPGSGGSDTGGTGSGTGGGPDEPIDCEDPGGQAPAASWVNATGNLAGMPSECGNLTIVSAVPCATRIIAGIAKDGLWASDDGGASWSKLGQGAGSSEIVNRPSAVVYDPLDPARFWVSGIYNGNGVYRSEDGGETLTALGEIGHNDLVAVDFSDPQRGTLLAGGHEQKQTLYLSSDGGGSWSNVGGAIPGQAHFSSLPMILDAQTWLLGTCGWGDGTCGIWRTTNGGDSWDMASDLPAQSAPLRAKGGKLFWSLGGGGLALSEDEGASWSQASANGLAGAPPIELPDGRIVVAGNDHLQISDDGGQSFAPIGEPLPFAPAGVVYSSVKKQFFVWHWDCGEVVLADAIASAGFDWQTQ